VLVETGLPARKEMHYNADGLNAWYDISIVKWGDIGLVITFNDVTERKQSEIEREQTNLLIQTMLNASFHGKALLAPIKDHEENIIDFKVIATNSAAEKQININPSVAIGKPLSEILPGYIKTGGFEKYKKVFETGKHLRYEQFYKDDTFEGWFDIYLSPVTNGIVVSFANITKSKEEAIRIQQQKNLLNAIMTHSPSGISVTEVIRDEQRKVIDGRTLLANKAAIEYIGIPEEFYLTKTATELDPGIIESPLYQMAVKTLETGETFHTQYFIEQSKRWLELSVAKMDEEHLINVFTDITGSKEVQLQVEQFAEKLNTVIDTSQTGFFLGSPAYDERGEIIDFRFTLVNQVMASYVGKQPKELMGQLGSDWFITYKKNGLFERFKETWLTGARQQFDIHYQGETVEVWANIMTAKLGDELLGSFTDFTPIKQLQLQLEKSVEELVRSNANLEQFAYAASHDLQEPLRKINFFSEQLRKDLSQRLTEDNIRKFDRMQNATNRMKILINDLLDYSKVSVKPDVYEDVELSDVVEQVLQDLEATILATGAVINVGRLPQIKGDEQQLTHVFQNILSNALKYRKLDTITVVTISSKIVAETDLAFATINDVKKGSYHLIEIIDNGIGFEQQQSEKIFQVFQRLHGRAEYEGTGVGLAIVQKVISNHKGYITALSEPGKGARFLITLPA
jgi:signal transduction histidine kinase/predicted transcriptional regulator